MRCGGRFAVCGAKERRQLLDAHFEGVLFDLDGTLIDSHDLILASFRHTTREVLGKEIPDERLMCKVGQPLVTQMWDFAENEQMHEELLRVYRSHNERVHDDMVRPFPGVSETLSALRDAGLPLGVVTSKRHALAQHGLEMCGLAEFFEFVVSPDDWPEHKPAPGPVLHGCDLLGISASSCLYVGDSPFDMQAGTGAGCFTAAALWGMFPARDLRTESPDYLCENMLEVKRAVLG